MTEQPDSQTQRKRIIRQRNLVLGGVLVAFVVLIFAISIVKMG